MDVPYATQYYRANKAKLQAGERRRYHSDPEKRERKLATNKKWRENHLSDFARYQRKHRAKDPIAARKSNTEYARKYKGLPEATRPTPSGCECCGRTDSKYALALDHCHDTGVFRGWLCNKCNSAIGMLGDNVEGLQRAIAYLRNVKVIL